MDLFGLHIAGASIQGPLAGNPKSKPLRKLEWFKGRSAMDAVGGGIWKAEKI